MSVPKTEWNLEIKKFLESNYDPINSPLEADEYTVKLTLREIYKQVTCVLPSTFIYQDDVYQALTDLGFKNFGYSTEPKEDQEGNIVVESELEYAYFLNKKTAAI
ncbi:hypothetical protein [Mesonia sp. HuA40]|uniref:hypothetical protein n=1 Tax=Mesonia sp. HuA40 TaxID=2602761 RepID=UPI0011CC01E0|nr:hypothetical protein [Mesonia sp. HuA40]TXK73947.1 hypothetical protein FT993_03550 [Mesonia sp. HuA40]